MESKTVKEGKERMDREGRDNCMLVHYALALRDIYDELFELNLTKGTYRIVYHTEHKYVIPSPEGETAAMMKDVMEHMVHPDDKERFAAFFDLERIRETFLHGRDSLAVEFRKLRETGDYKWAEVTVLPVRDTEDEIMLCYIMDIDARKQMEEKNAALQEICNFTAKNEYEYICLIHASAGEYMMYSRNSTVYEEPVMGRYDSMIRDFSKVVDGEDRENFLNHMLLEPLLSGLRAGDGQLTFEFRSLESGGARWTEAKVIYFRDNKDMLLCTIRDIHENRMAEENNKIISDKFLYSFGSIYSDIIELEPYQGSLGIIKSYMEPGLENSGRYSVDDLLDRYKRYIHKDDYEFLSREVSRDAFINFLESGQRQKSIEIRCMVEEGRYEWMEFSFFEVSHTLDGKKKVLFTARNVNEQKLLKGIVDRFVYDNCDYFIYLDVKHDSYVMFSSTDNGTPLPPAASDSYTEELTNYNREYVVPWDAERVVEAMKPERISLALKENKEYIIYCGMMNQASEYTRKKLQFVYYDKSNDMVLLTRTDVTHIYNEEKRKNDIMRNALAQAEQANRAKSDFLSRMSHDIRTPMNAIMGMAAIARLKLDDKDRVRDCLDKINTSSRYLLSLINDVLDMSKIESGKMLIAESRFDFIDFIQNITAIVYPQAEEQGIALDINVEEPIEHYYIGDSLRINQILVNLISNSLKYTNPGGKVAISIRETGRHEGKAALEFRVLDTGCGMTKEFMDKMYEPFEQEYFGVARNQAGSGLGLSIVNNLVKLMDGTIKVWSKEAEGTVFTVTLELGMDQETVKEPAGRKKDVTINKYVLIADIDREACRYTEKLLGTFGIRTDSAVSVQEVIAKVENAGSHNNYYDMIILNWKLPDQDGIGAARQIRRLVPREKTGIVMTAYDWISLEEEARAAGVDDFLSKPLFHQSLLELFTRFRKKNREAEVKEEPGRRFRGQRLLLAEDNEINMEIARELLEYQGLIIETAENGKIAYEMYKNAESGYYMAILMDIRMPVMDGLESARAIRSLSKDHAKPVPIIAMTANAFQEDMDTALETGMNSYLVKPIEVERLYRMLEDILL